MSSDEIPPKHEEDPTAVVPRSVGRVLDLLEIVAESGPCSLTAAAGSAGLTPTTALRHLRALETRGYVARAGDGRFTVGTTVLRLLPGRDDVTPLQRLLAAAQPHLDEVVARTGETCYLATAKQGYATYVAWSQGTRAIRHVGWLGRHVPLAGTALGSALAQPGVSVVRSGAVEPDITAIAAASLTVLGGPAAISLLGPSHRLRGEGRRVAERAVADAISRVEETLA